MKKFSFKKLLNRTWFGYRNSGPYRFVIRNWSGVTDINILADALSTETFRANIRPKLLPIKQAKSILVLAPHQDDELIGAGGLLLKARDLGINLTIVFVTNGAQNNLKFDGKSYSSAETIKLRESEARLVCNQLSAQYHCLGVDNITMAINQSHVAELDTIIKDTNADLVLTPWLFDGSRKHRAINQLLRHALAKETLVSEIWGYQVNNTPFANGYVEMTDWITEKISLLEIYKSQNEGIRRYEHQTRGLNAWNSRFLPSKIDNTTESYVEIFCTVPVKEYCNLIDRHYLPDLEKTYLGDERLISTMSNLRNIQRT